MLRVETSFDEGHNLVDIPLEGCPKMFVREGSPSLGWTNVIPNPLKHYHDSIMCSQPSSSFPEYTYDVPTDNLEICEFNVDMGHENNLFNMLGGNDDNFESLA